jgi:hypothetical protein
MNEGPHMAGSHWGLPSRYALPQVPRGLAEEAVPPGGRAGETFRISTLQ